MAGGGLQFPKNSNLPTHGLVGCGADPGIKGCHPTDPVLLGGSSSNSGNNSNNHIA